MRRHRLPEITKTPVRLQAPDQVLALANAMPQRYAVLVLLGAAAGLRQGEAFGLACDCVDAVVEMISVDQQVIIVGCRA
jgi:integrase